MILKFSKYHGTGNDFILVDNRANTVHLTAKEIAELCHRRFGIGADGLLLMNEHPNYDFQMINYNSDGAECSMCGNGGRTLVQFARDLGMNQPAYRFLAVDGEHLAHLKNGEVELKMQDVSGIFKSHLGIRLETGSPHLVVESKNLNGLAVVQDGRSLRHAPEFLPHGLNINFIEPHPDHLQIRTYERGVEDETFSCGTGAVAAAIASSLESTAIGSLTTVRLQTRGGALKVRFERHAIDQFKNIWLIGEAKHVFSGEVLLPR